MSEDCELQHLKEQFHRGCDALLERDFRRLTRNNPLHFNEEALRILPDSFSQACKEFMQVREDTLDYPAFEIWYEKTNYPRRFPAYTKTYKDLDLLKRKAFEHWLSLRVTDGVAGKTFLDVGCATSPFGQLVEHEFGGRNICYRADLPLEEYGFKPGLHGTVIGCSADAIPLPEKSVSRIFAHNAIEHFEGSTYPLFFKECVRLLHPGGTLCILPLFVAAKSFSYVSLCGVYRRLSFPKIPAGLDLVYSDRVGQPYALHIDADYLFRKIVGPLSGQVEFSLIRWSNSSSKPYGVALGLVGRRI